VSEPVTGYAKRPDQAESVVAPASQYASEPADTEGSEGAVVEVVGAGLRGILDALLKVDGVTAALVVGRDGFVIEAASADTLDGDAVGAIAASSLAAAEGMGEALKLGVLGSILIEFEQGPVAVTLVGPDAVLAVVGNQGTNLGRVRIEMKKIRQAVANQL
jgi:uncharacterized protein